MKYIRTTSGIFIFPKYTDHDSFAYDLQMVAPRDMISAGFVMPGNSDPLICYGKSMTLELESLDEDTRLLTRQLEI